MFEIFNDHVTAYIAPHKSHIARILRKTGKLRKITVSSVVGEEWSAHAEDLSKAGIGELEVFCEGEGRGFEWLKAFAFVEKLYLHSGVLPEIGVLQEFKGLKELGLGDVGSRKVNDLSKVGFLLESLQSLTLSGVWSGCGIITSYGIECLSLSGFKSEEEVFLRNGNVQSLLLHGCKDFSFHNLKEMKMLESLKILSKINNSELPDLSEHPSLAQVFLESEKNLQLFKNILPKSTTLRLL